MIKIFLIIFSQTATKITELYVLCVTSGLNGVRYGYLIAIHLPPNITTVDTAVVDSCVLEERDTKILGLAWLDGREVTQLCWQS